MMNSFACATDRGRQVLNPWIYAFFNAIFIDGVVAVQLVEILVFLTISLKGEKALKYQKNRIVFRFQV